MILATVGTHEDPFNRLLEALDDLVERGVIQEKIVCQSGYCTYDAKHVECHKQLPFNELQALMAEARIIITHGGPASIMQALAHGTIPVVVPRQAEHGEHVDNHQCRFAEKMSDRVLTVFDIEELEGCLVDYEARIAALPTTDAGPDRAKIFAAKLDALCLDLLTH
jgi:UDP-N-acetylglucosamine transferase subunit ALG13